MAKDAGGHGSEKRGGRSGSAAMNDESSYRNRHTINYTKSDGTPADPAAVAAGAHSAGVQAVGQPEPPTPVIYKKDSDGGVFAAFPTLPGDMSPNTMQSYAHIGQHSAADMGYVSSAKPAKPAEYADLDKELRGIGYNPQPIQRMTSAHLEARRAALKG